LEAPGARNPGRALRAGGIHLFSTLRAKFTLYRFQISLRRIETSFILDLRRIMCVFRALGGCVSPATT
jgi:hypothetical protein